MILNSPPDTIGQDSRRSLGVGIAVTQPSVPSSQFIVYPHANSSAGQWKIHW
jgi:hypothetical protein